MPSGPGPAGGGGGEVSFEEAFEASDAELRRASIPDEMPLDYVRERCEKIEKVLRLQFKPNPLPGPMQQQLATCPADGSPEDLVERWVTLAHLLRCERDNLHGHGTGRDDEDTEEAVRKLLQREPIRIDVADHRLEVTGRSYAAMIEMARHEIRIDELREDAARAAELREELEERIAATDGAEQRACRRRLKRVGRVHRAILQEVRLHRRALYAHATTEDGSPAENLEEAPAFWDQIGPREHLALLTALFKAGPGRLDRLGKSPPSEGGRDFREDWGFKSMIAAFEGDMKIDPASYFDRDLGQLITWMRAQAREPIDGG